MKRLFYLVMAGLMVMAVSCKKDKPQNGNDQNKIYTPEVVDIGLVVEGKNVKWASFNLGASKEYEFGHYYAWGESTLKDEYSPYTYTFKDTPVVLPLNVDVANNKLGGKWRMPTSNEYQALLLLKNNSNYNWEPWVSVKDDKGNDVYGFRVTNISTSASLFFPAAGMMGMSGYKEGGEAGNYWASDIVPSTTASRILCFTSIYAPFVTQESRHAGLSIRPVYED